MLSRNRRDMRVSKVSRAVDPSVKEVIAEMQARYDHLAGVRPAPNPDAKSTR